MQMRFHNVWMVTGDDGDFGDVFPTLEAAKAWVEEEASSLYTDKMEWVNTNNNHWEYGGCYYVDPLVKEDGYTLEADGWENDDN